MCSEKRSEAGIWWWSQRKTGSIDLKVSCACSAVFELEELRVPTLGQIARAVEKTRPALPAGDQRS